MQGKGSLILINQMNLFFALSTGVKKISEIAFGS